MIRRDLIFNLKVNIVNYKEEKYVFVLFFASNLCKQFILLNKRKSQK